MARERPAGHIATDAARRLHECPAQAGCARIARGGVTLDSTALFVLLLLAGLAVL